MITDPFQPFENVSENNETLLTILTYDISYESYLEIVERELVSARKITNPSSKYKVNNCLYALKNWLENKSKEVEITGYSKVPYVNSVFLIGDAIFVYPLSNQQVSYIKEYNVRNDYFSWGTTFKIDFLQDVLFSTKFNSLLKISKTSSAFVLEHIHCTLYKSKSIESIQFPKEEDLIAFITNMSKSSKEFVFLYYTTLKFTNKVEQSLRELERVLVFNKQTGVQEMFLAKTRAERMKSNDRLEKKCKEMNDEKKIDTFIFGKKKDFFEAIESYLVKELYIEETKWNKWKKELDTSLLNFEVIMISSLEKGDFADSWIENYKGMMGIKYY